MSNKPVVVWFRRDLRLADNPALDAAVQTGRPLIPLFIFEDVAKSDQRPMGGASKWWLDKSLRQLSVALADRRASLIIKVGSAIDIFDELMRDHEIETVFWNRRYDAPSRQIDTELKASLKSLEIGVETFNGSLLTEPWTQKTASGSYYRVFTPYWKSIRTNYSATAPILPPDRFNGIGCIQSLEIDDLGLHPASPDWSEGFEPVWSPGEAGAVNRLTNFVSNGLSSYSDNRNRPDVHTGTSGLSPHLAFGEISPVTIWRVIRAAMDGQPSDIPDEHAWTFLSEIVWREFSYVLLYHNDNLATENYNSKFDVMPWRNECNDLRAWQRGLTGYPIVDAGMRQLWQTGWMHNRVRMIVASFLTKHLLIDWRRGEEWFWDTLVDADPASNSASWQWTAGSGADAAPYFRVFNPITQGQKFDPSGDYVRRFVPELKKLETKYLHAPWEAPDNVLVRANITLGATYPKPIVDHKVGRERALSAYETVKSEGKAA